MAGDGTAGERRVRWCSVGMVQRRRHGGCGAAFKRCHDMDVARRERELAQEPRRHQRRDEQPISPPRAAVAGALTSVRCALTSPPVDLVPTSLQAARVVCTTSAPSTYLSFPNWKISEVRAFQ